MPTFATPLPRIWESTRLSGDTRKQNECSLTWTINSLRERIESMGRANSTESIGAALMDAVQRLEKVEPNSSA